MIAASDLPKSTTGAVVFDLMDIEETATVRMVAPGKFYGDTGDFDFEGTADEMVAKLNKWGAIVAGWEAR